MIGVDVYFIGKYNEDNTALKFAFRTDGTFTHPVCGEVNGTSKLELAIKAMGVCIKHSFASGDMTVHSALKEPVDYGNGTFKPLSDITKKFTRYLDKLESNNHCKITFDTELPQEMTEKLTAMLERGEKTAEPLEQPLVKPKREVKSSAGIGWDALKAQKPRFSVTVYNKDGSTLCKYDNHDFRDDLKSAAWFADWYEQVDKMRVERENVPVMNDLSGRHGMSYTITDANRGVTIRVVDGKVVNSKPQESEPPQKAAPKEKSFVERETEKREELEQLSLF